MRVLIIEHDHVSPPGPVAERFRFHGFTVDQFLVVPAEKFDEPNVEREFPNLADYDVVVPMGAPWGAWDDDRIGAWLKPELDFISEAISTDVPIFGISAQNSTVDIARISFYRGGGESSGYLTFSTKFDSSFYCFSTRIHGQQFVIAQQLGDESFVFSQSVIVKCPGSEGQCCSLLCKRLDDPGVAMALVDR